jgi:hypothetical protein
MIVVISLLLITIGLVLYLSFGPGNGATQQYYMAAAPAKKNDCPGGKKRDPKTGACPVDKKVVPKKVDPKSKTDKPPDNCKDGMKIDPKTGKCVYKFQGRGWDAVVNTALLTGNQPTTTSNLITASSIPVNGKCGQGTFLQGDRCYPNAMKTPAPARPTMGVIVQPNNPIVTGIGFGDLNFNPQGGNPQGGNPPPAVNPAGGGDKPKPKPPAVVVDQPPPAVVPPVVVVPAGGDKPKPRPPPVKCKAGYIKNASGECVPDPTVEDLDGEDGGGVARRR